MSVSGLSACTVVGGGPAGLTVARLLAMRGWRVVIAAGERNTVRRLELLAPAALQTIAAVGLEAVLEDRSIARACLGIRRPGVMAAFEDFMMHSAGQGHVIDRLRFDDYLREAALAAGVQILPLRVNGITQDGAALHVRDPAGRRTMLPISGIVIDATGRSAAVARRQGASIAFRDRMIAELVEEVAAPADLPPEISVNLM
jgi:flavin-dependent dehydrogenase